MFKRKKTLQEDIETLVQSVSKRVDALEEVPMSRLERNILAALLAESTGVREDFRRCFSGGYQESFTTSVNKREISLKQGRYAPYSSMVAEIYSTVLVIDGEQIEPSSPENLRLLFQAARDAYQRGKQITALQKKNKEEELHATGLWAKEDGRLDCVPKP